MLDPGQRKFTFELGSESKGLEKALEVRHELEESHPEIKRIEFLYKNYEPQAYNFEVFETLRKLMLTGGLVFLKPGTGAQIIMAMLMCLAAMRVYAAKKPFIEGDIDTISEAAQWQLFFVMFSALAMRVNLDGESLQEQKAMDYMMLSIQGLAPATMILSKLIRICKGNTKENLNGAASASAEEYGGGGVKDLKSEYGGDDDEEIGKGGKGVGAYEMSFIGKDEENGLQLTNIFSGMARGAVLGGRGQATPRTSKFDVGNPLTNPPSNNPNAGKQSVKASGLLKVDSKGNVGPSNAGRPKSSFDTYKNPNLMGGGKGGSKGGSKGGMNKKSITKEAPKRKSMFAIPKEHLEDAPTGPPKIPPPIPEEEDDDDDDIGPPPFPPPAAEVSLPPPRPVCQWTEQWSEEYQTVYYLNLDGVTSTWDMPDDFWRDEKR
ncbi:hypothetical protein TrST_g3626 [Triparma strigata]|uniref:WW domain-containing protein n=1 Tax=Triparma strigata TaxID=1606541 RepID=A0A9W7A9D2_9STRA|nr:hypothetical protein TrST_g3626 [Triparma strigata]